MNLTKEQVKYYIELYTERLDNRREFIDEEIEDELNVNLDHDRIQFNHCYNEDDSEGILSNQWFLQYVYIGMLINKESVDNLTIYINNLIDKKLCYRPNPKERYWNEVNILIEVLDIQKT